MITNTLEEQLKLKIIEGNKKIWNWTYSMYVYMYIYTTLCNSRHFLLQEKEKHSLSKWLTFSSQEYSPSFSNVRTFVFT